MGCMRSWVQVPSARHLYLSSAHLNLDKRSYLRYYCSLFRDDPSVAVTRIFRQPPGGIPPESDRPCAFSPSCSFHYSPSPAAKNKKMSLALIRATPPFWVWGSHRALTLMVYLI